MHDRRCSSSVPIRPRRRRTHSRLPQRRGQILHNGAPLPSHATLWNDPRRRPPVCAGRLDAPCSFADHRTADVVLLEQIQRTQVVIGDGIDESHVERVATVHVFAELLVFRHHCQ